MELLTIRKEIKRKGKSSHTLIHTDGTKIPSSRRERRGRRRKRDYRWYNQLDSTVRERGIASKPSTVIVRLDSHNQVPNFPRAVYILRGTVSLVRRAFLSCKCGGGVVWCGAWKTWCVWCVLSILLVYGVWCEWCVLRIYFLSLLSLCEFFCWWPPLASPFIFIFFFFFIYRGSCCKGTRAGRG